MATQHDERGLVGCRVVSSDNEDVGTVDEVFIDDQTHQPAFVSVKGGIFGLRERMVPLQGARIGTDQVQVPFDRQRIKDAPNSGSADGTSPQATAELYRHYGISRSDLPGQRSGEAAATGGDAAASGRDRAAMGEGRTPSSRAGEAGDEAGDEEIAVTRSEEEMHVGTERREAGRVHVNKRVETEEVQRTVPTSHEEAHVEREPIAAGDRLDDAAIGEEDQEMTLHEQRPVVSTESVPVERVRVNRDEVQDEETVSGQVRKERVDVTRDADPDAEERRRGE